MTSCAFEGFTGAAVAELRERDDSRRRGGAVRQQRHRGHGHLGQAVELRDRARRFDAVAEDERPGIQRGAEEVDAGRSVLDVVLDAVAAAEIDRRDGALDADGLIDPVGDEVGAGRAVTVVDRVDARLGNRQSGAGAGARGAEIDAAPRRDVVAGVERPQEIVLLDDAGRR